jgi:hypothetical protein
MKRSVTLTLTKSCFIVIAFGLLVVLSEAMAF